MDLNLSVVRKRIKLLRNEIKKQDELYYIKSSPIITDQQYDELRNELENLESLYPELRDEKSVTQMVGTKVAKGFAKIRHTYPMLSLSNAFSEEDISDFLIRIKKLIGYGPDDKLELYCEPKIDGVSFSAHFKNGKLNFAITTAKILETIDFDDEEEKLIATMLQRRLQLAKITMDKLLNPQPPAPKEHSPSLSIPFKELPPEG